MKCTCPKCQAKIEIELPEVPESGTSVACTECNARFNVFRESFGGRALRKTSELSCAPCGEELGPQTFCPTCGAQFPDYFVATLGKKRVQRSALKLKLKGSPLHRAEKSAPLLPTLEMSMKGEPVPALPAAPARFPKARMIAIALLVLLVLGGAGGAFYLKYSAEKTYVHNFVLATYGVQVGTDKCMRTSAQMGAEWKAKSDAGESFRPRLAMEDERELGIIHGKIESASSQLENAPGKFGQCNERLSKLKGVYNKAHALILTPGNSYQAFAETSNKINAEYKQAVREFKAGIPEEMMEELTSASKRYKGLRPLLKI